MQKLNLTKKIMQAALLLGASRSYMGKERCILMDLRCATSTAVFGLTYSAIATGGLPLTLTTGICLGILCFDALNLFGHSVKIIRDGGFNSCGVLNMISGGLLFIGIMYLECYVWPTRIISIISVLNCLIFILFSDFEAISKGKPKLANTILLIETLISIVGMVSVFAPMSLFGMPVILIILYLKAALSALSIFSPIIPNDTWGMIGL